MAQNGVKRSAKTIGKRMKRAKWGTSERERTPSLSLPSQLLGLLGSLICFFALSILFFAFYPTKEPGPGLGEKLNREKIEATYAAAKKILKKNSGLYRIQIFYLCNQSAAPVSVNGSNPVTARIISAFLLLHLYPQRSSLHLK